MKPFVLSNGTVVNSYGFRVRTGGINFERFDNNPVMLSEHNNSIGGILGKWTNRTIDGVTLSATPEFDEADETALKIKGKVERGYLKGASIGIRFDPEKLQLMPDGVWELTACELMEVSLCAIPSNSAALRLYAKDDGRLLDEKEVLLSLSAMAEEAVIDKSKNENKDMKKVILSLAALTALDLQKANSQEGVDVAQVELAIADLNAKLAAKTGEYAQLKTAYDLLKTQADAAAKLKADTLIDNAIAAGKIDATKKEDWQKLALGDFALAENTLAAIPSKKTLGGQINNPAPADVTTVKSADDFQKLPINEQLAFKNAHPEAYRALFA